MIVNHFKVKNRKALYLLFLYWLLGLHDQH